MATTRILLGVFCFVAIGGRTLPERNLLTPPQLRIAVKELGVREAGGNNQGLRVRLYLMAAGVNTPAPWCAAFVSWVFRQTGAALPRTPWSPALFPAARIRSLPLPGHVFGIYFPELKRIAHCGFVEAVNGDWIQSIEGNTNVAGSREGDGVYRKWRHRRSIHRYADWGVGHE